jgi:hypothetical protein
MPAVRCLAPAAKLGYWNHLYGDCASLLDRITKQQGAAVPGGIQAIGDTNLILSECAEQCSKALEKGACPGCKQGGEK